MPNTVAEVVREVSLLTLTANGWTYFKNIGFNYDATIEYENLPQIYIGKMSIMCEYCNALRFVGETKNMCCSSGKVSINQNEELPQPLQSLINNTHEKSKLFLPLLRKYNSCFNMTSFRTTANSVQPDIFTFKVQGQVYHRVGSLMAENSGDAKFLQIYFMGNEEEEIEKRNEIIPDTDIELLRELQKMLHHHNHYIKVFKTAMETEVNDDFQVVIKANKRPVGEHARVFNAPSSNEVAIIMNGIDFEKRDIVLKKRSNELQSIDETHIAYDGLQYPLMFPRGESGYSINLKQINPATKIEITKTVSAMAYYVFQMR